jgi:thymidylate synthase ThyX
LEPVRELWTTHLEGVEDTLYLTECELGLRVPPGRVTPHNLPADACFRFTMSDIEDLQKNYYEELPDEVNRQLLKASTSAQLRSWLRWVPNPDMPFAQKKKLTSACRRIIPQGIVNEMGFSINLRALRHVVMMRTAAGAEWEIREIFGQVYRAIKDKYPLVFHGAKERMVDGALEVYGMRQQPYELTREQVLADMTPDEIAEYLDLRQAT